jgi:hypothetical protein
MIEAPPFNKGQRGIPVLATPSAKIRTVFSRSFDLRSSRMTNPVESNVTDATKGHPFIIRSRIPAVTHAATASVAQIEFAASQNRQEVTKLDEKEADAATEIRFCTELDEKLLMYRFKLVVTLIVVFNAPERIRLLAAVNDEVKRSDPGVPSTKSLEFRCVQNGSSARRSEPEALKEHIEIDT